jgi:streptomycin 6-kinase
LKRKALAAGAVPSTELRRRIDERVRHWRVAVERTMDTESSVIIFGRRGGQPVVLKVVRHPGDEWRVGEMLDCFDGGGVVRVHEYIAGAVLMERIIPGDPLVALVRNGRDDDATEILADVIARLSPRASGHGTPTVEAWARGFARYAATGDARIPGDLVEAGQRVYLELCGSQSQPRLLHGDLQHYNVLSDSRRGWLAIDPKGVVGELEYEAGAILRNPYERHEWLIEQSTIEKRIRCLSSKLHLDARRMLAWAFAQAVLSAIWDVEDGIALASTHPS